MIGPELAPAVKLCGAVVIHSNVGVPVELTWNVPLALLTLPSVIARVRFISATYAVTPLIVPTPELQAWLPYLRGHASPAHPVGAELTLPDTTPPVPR